MSEMHEQPVMFARRNLFKGAAAGAAAMVAGAAGVHAAPAKEGTFANNGAPVDCRVRNDRLSDENKKTLMAVPSKYVPVAVKFYAVKPENFGLKYKKTDKRMSLCQFVSYAQKTHSSFYIDKNNEDCMGRTVLGMVQEPPLGASGQAGFDFGVFRNQNANARAVLDALNQNYIRTLENENQSLKLAASQANQNAVLTAAMDANQAELIRRLGRDCPVPAYVVPNPNCCYNPCGTCG